LAISCCADPSAPPQPASTTAARSLRRRGVGGNTYSTPSCEPALASSSSGLSSPDDRDEAADNGHRVPVQATQVGRQQRARPHGGGRGEQVGQATQRESP